jgi:hypothetical protein
VAKLAALISEGLAFQKMAAPLRNLEKSLANELDKEFYKVAYAGCFASTRELRKNRKHQLFRLEMLQELPAQFESIFSSEIEYIQSLDKELVIPEPGKKAHLNEIVGPLM